MFSPYCSFVCVRKVWVHEVMFWFIENEVPVSDPRQLTSDIDQIFFDPVSPEQLQKCSSYILYRSSHNLL